MEVFIHLLLSLLVHSSAQGSATSRRAGYDYPGSGRSPSDLALQLTSCVDNHRGGGRHTVVVASAHSHGIPQQLFDPSRASATPPTNVFVGNFVAGISWKKKNNQGFPSERPVRSGRPVRPAHGSGESILQAPLTGRTKVYAVEQASSEIAATEPTVPSTLRPTGLRPADTVAA